MKYVELAGKQASVIGLGLWQFGSSQWGEIAEANARQIIHRALDLGVNFFDTAELYGHGGSESVLGRALAGRRDEAIIASKVSPLHLSYRGVIAAAERSLQHLGTDHIDLYQIHWPNRFVPIVSTMLAMRTLREEGRIGAVGVSNFSLNRWRKAEAALNEPVVANQVQFHLLDQRPSHDLLPEAQERGRVIIAYSPLAQGALGGKYDASNRPQDFRHGRPVFQPQSFARMQPLLEELQSIAKGHEATPAQVALAWLTCQPGVIAIPGARTVEQLEANAAAGDIELSQEEELRLGELGRQCAPADQRISIRWLAGKLLGA